MLHNKGTGVGSMSMGCKSTMEEFSTPLASEEKVRISNHAEEKQKGCQQNFRQLCCAARYDYCAASSGEKQTCCNAAQQDAG